MRAAVIQMRGDQGLEGNLDSAARLLRQAATEGARMVALPENFAYLHQKPLADVAAAEKLPSGPARKFASSMALELGIWLIAGTIPVADGAPGDEGKPFAASILYSPDGGEWARYDKIHLFDVHVKATGKMYRESDDYRAGKDVVTATVGDAGESICLGLSVCYDLRFPELYRQQSRRGAQVLAAPSAFTRATGEAHWTLLLRARAVENLCFVLAANMADRQHPRNPTWGGSAIIDPWGRVLAELKEEEGYAVADLDLDLQAEVRRNMPALSHRRLTSV
jgi:deaminated glutathione amidase